MTAHPLRSTYQLKVTLKGTRPPIWRRLQMVSTDSLEDLHIALQITMGWDDEHLHQFVKGGTVYGIPDDEFQCDTLEEDKFRLEQVLTQEKNKIDYEYDFGDGWLHEVVLEKILPFDTNISLPVCIKGVRACPPEDVGGVARYEILLKTLADPSDSEYEEMLEWVGEDFDAEHFDLNEVNNQLCEYGD